MPSRRTLLAGVGIALAGGTTGAALASRPESPSSSPFDWPMAQYDPAGTGYNPDASGPTDDVQVAWEHDSTEWFRGASAPIRLGDTLYAVGNGLVALEVDSGERQFARHGPYTSSAAVARASAYRTETLAVTSTGGVYGLNASGGLDVPGLERGLGSQRWEGPGSGQYRPTSEHAPTTDPIAVDETVYATVPGTNDLVAVDASDGTERWRVTVEDDDIVSASFGRPTVRDGTVYVANWPNRVSAYDREDGTERWQRDLEDQMQLSSPATEEGVVVTSRNGVTLLDSDEGNTIWRRDLEGNAIDGAAAVAEGTVFLSDGNDRFHALDLETGESLWSVPFERETTPVVADGMVYAVEHDAVLVALEADTGEEQFRYEPPEVPLSPPIVGDGRLYAVNRGRIVALAEEP
ncbi:PQQ-binding-like beta-propeller repeat protein [Natronobacterium texcoconense]|uniref:Outer membrane protein assembly factor BamB, contains PQQ-like beta-propeller repeat n=1 Tax=Natronobacterium texcoconense TaxID=1095778 RepID=A0A1H1FVZ2_NATTX|nr:PQQ-binding-like beta-propeller repeat protein [Natronobacterium texcoconense]SDR05060.1 Outer membrane protein assembly factor BamB, contains PQQ-like beta-propeller repeat [Natronobacterium texcoconense]